MKKLNGHMFILWGAALAVVIALMILIPFARTATWWIAAACTLMMFGVTAFMFTRSFRRGKGLASKILGWPIFRVAYAALIVQVIVGFVLMGLAFLCPVWIAALAEIVVFAVTAACLTVKDAAREVVARSEAQVKDDTAAWKALRVRAASIASETNHPEIKKLAEAIRYADPRPTSLDNKVAEAIETLSGYATAENIQKASRLLEQRNALAKTEK